MDIKTTAVGTRTSSTAAAITTPPARVQHEKAKDLQQKMDNT